MNISNSKSGRLATVGIMIALAFILSYVESLLPSFTGIPGVKIGLANIVSMTALYILNCKYAICITLIRVILSGLIFSGMSAMLYGLAGSILSLTVILLLRSFHDRLGNPMFSVPAISISGGIMHNTGQLLVSWAFLGKAVLYYLPALIISGLVAGLITGVITYYIIRYIPTRQF